MRLIPIGKRLVECILEGKKWPKLLPKITNREIAVQLGDILLKELIFHRSEKDPEHKGVLKVCSSLEVDPLMSFASVAEQEQPV